MFPDRREVMRMIGSASLGAMLPASKSMGYDVILSSAGTDFAPARNRIQQAIARGGATGVAVAVAQGGRIVWEEGFGWADRKAGVMVTPHTPFSMASVTKPFTTTTLMTLVAEGKLSLDEAANKYLGKARVEGVNGNAEAATVRLLGAHASGLPGMYESYDAGEAKLAPTPDVLLETYGRLAYPPAICYEYSNIGFAALNAIASALTNTDLGTLMQQRVLGPLGLKDSFFRTNTARLATGATRYDPLGHAIPHYITSTPASGELYASAHDLAHFAMFNMRSRVTGHADILSDHDIDELHKPVFNGPSGVATSFGWFTGHTPSGVPFLFKSGGDPGVANRMYMVPSRELACVVITNQSNATELAYGVCDQLIANYLPDWRQPEEYCGFPSNPFIATSVFRGRWEGTLENDGANTRIKLSIDSNDEATLAIGLNRAEKIIEMRAEGEAVTGKSTGLITSPNVIRTGAKTLQIKLLPREGKLVGRAFAVAGDANFKNVSLPYVLTLSRIAG